MHVENAHAIDASRVRRALAAWHEHDVTRSLHAVDREAIRATEAPRTLVVELLFAPRAPRDLYSACARLGRLLAEAGASPSLAASTLDGAAEALQAVGIPFEVVRLAPARASVAEGYVAAIVEAERAAARRAWDYPACAVELDDVTLAITCGYPADDGEALANWAARVAAGASRAGKRRAVVSGPAAARAELAAALGLVGIAVHAELPTPKRLRLPFWK
jgi:hypothetical protein